MKDDAKHVFPTLLSGGGQYFCMASSAHSPSSADMTRFLMAHKSVVPSQASHLFCALNATTTMLQQLKKHILSREKLHGGGRNIGMRRAYNTLVSIIGGNDEMWPMSPDESTAEEDEDRPATPAELEAFAIVNRNRSPDSAIEEAVESEDEEVVLEVLRSVRSETLEADDVPLVDVPLVYFAQARAADMVWHVLMDLDDGSSDRIRNDLDNLAIDAFRNFGESKVDEVEFLLNKGAVLSQEAKDELLEDAFELRHRNHVAWLLNNGARMYAE